ncbi:MAG: hypothetical protein EOM54_07710 [Clostridia bacterium]|nr:hypothetical protein [Clostridia bacterium]
MTETILTSSILILVIVALRYILRGKISLRLQYALWALVALRLLIPFSLFQSPVSVMNAVNAVGMPAVVSYDDSVPAGTLAGLPEAAQADYAAEREAEVVPAALETETETPTATADILRILWCIGMGVMALCLLISNFIFYLRLRKRAVPVEMPDCPLPVYRAEGLPSPCLYGVFRPAVYLTPESFQCEERLRHILAHELTHRRHLDHIWPMVRGACLVLHWFNPMVWLAAVLSKRDCELACDESTLLRLGEDSRLGYGRTLVGMMTARSGPADLFCCATTMTGGKRGIKERITLIAKKPRMTVIVLAAVLLITAAAVGCTFTGAESTPAETAAAEAATVSTVATREMTVEEQKLVVLSGMQMTFLDYDLSEDVNYFSLYVDVWTPEGLVQSDLLMYGEVGDGAGDFSDSGSFGIASDLRSGDDGSRSVIWRIQTGNAIAAFETALPKQADGAYTGYSSFGSVGTQAPYEIRTDEGAIVFNLCFGLEGNTVNAYDTASLNENRDLLNSTEDVVLALRLVPSTTLPEKTAASPTPSAEGQSAEDAGVEEAICGLYEAGGGIDLSLSVSGGGAFGTYNIFDRDYGDRLCRIAEQYVWTKTDIPGTTPSDYWVTVDSADGTEALVFWQGGDAETVQYTADGETTYWLVSPVLEQTVGIAEMVREIHDGLTMDYNRIVFSSDGSAGDTAALFVQEYYGNLLLSVAPGGLSSITDYEAVDWAVEEVGEDGNAILGWFKFAILPEDYDSTPFWAGSAAAGEGEYEGWIIKSLEFVLQKQNDEHWHCIGLGSGGYTLPEE